MEGLNKEQFNNIKGVSKVEEFKIVTEVLENRLKLKRQQAKAEKGDPEDQFNLGYIYSEDSNIKKDYLMAICWFEKAANQGHIKAQYEIGALYYLGDGVPKDYEKAKYWFEKAASQNSSSAQYNLGIMYKNGECVRKNKSVAKEWFGKTCENGLQTSCDAYTILSKENINY